MSGLSLVAQSIASRMTASAAAPLNSWPTGATARRDRRPQSSLCCPSSRSSRRSTAPTRRASEHDGVGICGELPSTKPIEASTLPCRRAHGGASSEVHRLEEQFNILLVLLSERTSCTRGSSSDPKQGARTGRPGT